MARVALVTGAARGIGAATVTALVADGWRVVAVDRCADDPDVPYPLGTRAELDALASDLVVTAVADTRDAAALANAVAAAEARWGGLDAAIAVAGVIAGGVPAWELPLEQERAVLDIDLGGLPMLAAYCAAKAGVTGFVRALAVELRGTGITANAVSPGSTSTAILDESARLYALPDAQAFATQQPLDRLLRPDEVAAAIAFLVGDGGSGITGAAVPVDGGLSV